MNKMKPLASALALAIYGTGALAQTGVLEEVIVTATKRAETRRPVTARRPGVEHRLARGTMRLRNVSRRVNDDARQLR